MADGTLIFDTKVDEKGFSEGTGGLAGLAEKGLGVLTGNLMTDALGKITDIGKNAISTGMSFETASSQIAATMGTTVDALTSDMDQYFGSTKINGEEFYGSLIDLAGELGAKTKFTATEAAEGLNILAQSGLNAQDQMSAMPTVLNLAAAGGMDLASTASYVTGAVKGFGGSMDEAQKYADLMAKGATLANTDVRGLGEALSGSAATAKSYGQGADEVTLALLRLAEQNVTGSVATTALNRAMADLYTPTADASAALADLGVSAYTLEGKARPVNEVMDDLNKAMATMSDEEKNAYKSTIFTSQGLQAFNKITSTATDKVEEFKEGLAEASEGMGAAAEQAHTMSDNLEGDITIMGSAMDGFYNAVYSKMQAPLRSLVQWGTSAISQLTEGLKNDGIGGMIEAGANIVENFVQGAFESIPSIIDTGKEFVSNLIEGIVGEGPMLDGTAMEVLGGFIGSLATKGVDLILSGYEWVTNIITGLLGKLPDLITAGGDLIAGFITSFMQPDNIGSLMEKGADIVKNLVKGLTENLPRISKAGYRAVIKIGKAIIDNLPYVLEKGKEIIKELLSGITEKLTDLYNKGKEVLDKVTDGISDSIINMFNKGKEMINNVIDGIVSLFTDLYNKGKEIVDNVKQGISDFMGGLFGVGSSAAGQAKSGFSSVDFTSVGSTFISKIKSGMEAAKSALVSTATEIGKAAFNALKSAADSGFTFDSYSVGSVPTPPQPKVKMTVKKPGSNATSSSADFSKAYTTGMTFADHMLQKAVQEMESASSISGTASYAEQAAVSTGFDFDYERLGQSVADALDGTEVKMDGQTVGNVVTPYVSENLADEAYAEERGVI